MFKETRALYQQQQQSLLGKATLIVYHIGQEAHLNLGHWVLEIFENIRADTLESTPFQNGSNLEGP